MSESSGASGYRGRYCHRRYIRLYRRRYLPNGIVDDFSVGIYVDLSPVCFRRCLHRCRRRYCRRCGNRSRWYCHCRYRRGYRSPSILSSMFLSVPSSVFLSSVSSSAWPRFCLSIVIDIAAVLTSVKVSFSVSSPVLPSVLLSE